MNKSRRAVLTAFGGGLTTLAGCSAVKHLGGAAYRPAALALAIGMECAPGDHGNVVVTLSWNWERDIGGTAPDDVVDLYWPDERWVLVEPAYRTTATVRFDGKGVVDGMEGVRFRHDDTAADGGATYAASCSLSPKGDGAAAVRNVYGEFKHLRQASNAERTTAQADGWGSDGTAAWTVARETDQRASSCPDGGAESETRPPGRP